MKNDGTRNVRQGLLLLLAAGVAAGVILASGHAWAQGSAAVARPARAPRPVPATPLEMALKLERELARGAGILMPDPERTVKLDGGLIPLNGNRGGFPAAFLNGLAPETRNGVGVWRAVLHTDDASGDMLFYNASGEHFWTVAADAGTWASECFKRLYQCGMRARFCGVSWHADERTTADYYLNVQNARDTAAQLAPLVNAMPGGKIWMAHSLWNMLSGYAIADCGMNVDKYFALNAAVPAEAYDTATVDERDSPDNYMQHSSWLGYSNRTWASSWYKLFPQGDDRWKLTWRSRFTNVLERTQLYNFWSSGDEVLEIATDGTPLIVELLNPWADTRRYIWHKQELYKGRNIVYGTGWAGWGFEYPTWQTVDGANASTDATLRQYPIFERDPGFMFTNVITQAHVDDILIKGIPSLSWPMGSMEVDINGATGRNIDMNNSASSWRPNDWPWGGDEYETRWLHSQLIYVAHFYAHKLYEKFVEIGELK